MIEDILNDDFDSDDELETTNIDLEDLLREDEGSSDNYLNNPITSYDETNFMIDSWKNNDINGSISTVQMSQDEYFINDDNNGILNFKSNEFDLKLSDKDDQLSALELADKREQRFLSLGNKEMVSVLKSTSLQSKNNDASNSIRFENMQAISSQLKRNSDYKQHGPGIATCVHANLRYLAVGTSRGFVLLFDYSQEIRQVLGSSVASSNNVSPAISAVDATPSGNYIVSGNICGEICLWDVLKGVALKTMNEIHESKIIRLNFSRNVAENSVVELGSLAAKRGVDNISDLSVVTVDSKGVVHRIKFSKSMWSSFSSESDCLLDGKSGIVTEMKSSKPIQEFAFINTSSRLNIASKASPTVDTDKIRIIIPCENKFSALCTYVRTYIIQTSPNVRVLYKWPLNINLPATSPSSTTSMLSDIIISLDWGWKTIRTGYSEFKAEPILYRSYSNNIESLCICRRDLTNNNASNDTLENYSFIPEKQVNLGIDINIIAMKLVSNSQITLLTLNEVYLLSENFEILERCILPKEVIDITSTITINMMKNNSIGFNPISSFTGYDQSIYILYKDSLYKCHAQLWLEKIERLVHDGKWLECLSLLCENHASLKPVEIVSPSNNKSSSNIDDNDIISMYLRKYLKLTMSSNMSQSHSTSSTNHYHLVAGVCLEMCVTIDRLDLLFGTVYDIFVKTSQQNIFLNALEPYILNRKIRSLTTDILNDLFDFSRKFNRLSSLERCLAYLNVDTIDINFLSKFLLENKMYSTFLYSFGYGSSDLAGAFESLFDRLFSIELNSNSSSSNNMSLSSSVLSPLQTDICYKLLLFIKYSVEGYIFPRHESVILPVSWLHKLIETIVSDRYIIPPIVSVISVPSLTCIGNSSLLSKDCRYPYLSLLVHVDCYAILFYTAKLLEILQNDESSLSIPAISIQITNYYHNIYQFIVALSYSNISSSNGKSNDSTSSFDNNSYEKLHYIYYNCLLSSNQLSTCTHQLPIDLIIGIIKYMKSHNNNVDTSVYNTNIDSLLRIHYLSENLLLQIIQNQKKYFQKLSNNSVGINNVEKLNLLLNTLESYGYWRIILELIEYRSSVLKVNDFDKALEFYVSDYTASVNNDGLNKDVESNLQIFKFIDLFFMSSSYNKSIKVSVIKDDQYKLIVLNRLQDLVYIDISMTKQTCCQYFLSYFRIIFDKLQEIETSIQYEVCSALINYVVNGNFVEATLTHQDHDDLSNIDNQNKSKNAAVKSISDVFTQDDVLNYIKLLIKYKPDKAYAFVSSQDHFPLDEVILLFKSSGILDAASVLIEKTGDVNSALELLLTDFSNYLQIVRNYVEDILRSDPKKSSEEMKSIKILLYHVLSNRNQVITPSVSSKDGSFSSILPSQTSSSGSTITNELFKKSPLFQRLQQIVLNICSLCHRHASRDNTDIWFQAFDHIIHERNKLSQGIVSSTGEVIRVLIGNLMQVLVFEMKDIVASHEIVRRVTKDYSGAKYIEFREVIINMLLSHQFEYRSLTCSHKIHIHDYQKLMKHKLSNQRRAERIDPSTHTMKDTASPDESFALFRQSYKKYGRRPGSYDQIKAKFNRKFGLVLSVEPPPLYLDALFEERRPGSLPFEAKFRKSISFSDDDEDERQLYDNND